VVLVVVAEDFLERDFFVVAVEVSAVGAGALPDAAAGAEPVAGAAPAAGVESAEAAVLDLCDFLVVVVESVAPAAAVP
jgi:hypothetical protein